VSDLQRVYAVHTTRPDEVGAVEIIFSDERQARKYALSRSNDFRILSASVTSYRIGELGTRSPIAWYQHGEEQHPRTPRPGQFYPTDGEAEVPALKAQD
jgi:hypothetical protein